ncbi:MAG: outer membrane protein assembly factor BamD [Fibrobacteraceae bacterium]|nr:outer membrane protein assembly factor BamD [Fibrobacteraceae bacterium]
MKSFKKHTLFYPLFWATLLLVGCASDQSGKQSHTEFCLAKLDGAEELYKNGKYGRAQEKLEEILSLCAGTGAMEKAQFMLAESYFNLELWIEARGEYGSFILNFPGSPFIETAEFRKAISSFNMEYKSSRDDANTTVAMKDFERYRSNYPESPLLDSVNYYYGLLVERMAEKEFQTARLYYRMDKPQASVIYLKEFLDVYKQSKRRKEAFLIIIKSYTELDQFDMARNYVEMAKAEIDADDKDTPKEIAKVEEKIASAEKDFEKRIKKDAEKKRIQKEESELTK